ncbi:hypothetical protein COP1_013257 [Malus domestica]
MLHLTSNAITTILGIFKTILTLLSLFINTGAILRLLITTGIEFEDERFNRSLMLFHLLMLLIDNAAVVISLKDGHQFLFLKLNLLGAMGLN